MNVPEPIDYVLLREAAHAGFHATPTTILALLDVIEAQHDLIVGLLDDPEPDRPQLALAPEPEPDPPPWDQLPLPLEDT